VADVLFLDMALEAGQRTALEGALGELRALAHDVVTSQQVGFARACALLAECIAKRGVRGYGTCRL
jgi:hypothetical protein